MTNGIDFKKSLNDIFKFLVRNNIYFSNIFLKKKNIFILNESIYLFCFASKKYSKLMKVVARI